jgi:pimeloyl-ACP methyl ester carboxylesterase
MNAPDYLGLGEGRRLAYHRTAPRGEGASRPGVLFLGGFASDMTGAKATHLEAWARAAGRAFLRFDYTGHGASSGRFEDGCVGDWARDAADALDRLTEGPQILVGSSMGGWIALLLVKARPDRIAGLVGIAAAPDFTEDAMWAAFSDAERATLMREGRLPIPNAYGPEPRLVTRRLIEDGRARLVLRAPLRCPFPVRLLHGTADADVPVATGLRLLEHLDAADARLTLVRGADHRFSGPAELDLIVRTVESLA